MRRREFLLAAGALVAPCLGAQPARKVTVAVLSSGKSIEDDFLGPPFFAEMQRHGWREGQNIVYQRFFTEGSRSRLAEVALAAAEMKPDLIYVPNAASASAARKATPTIPIVFMAVSDPVSNGLVASLSRPGGNATGVFHMGGDPFGKRLELIQEAIPAVKQVGVILDTKAGDYANEKRQLEETARPKGVFLQLVEVAGFDDAVVALPRMRRAGATAVTAWPSFTLAGRRRELAVQALQQGLALFGYRAEWAETGALFSYGADLAEAHQRSAEIADRILRGANPAETPVERASKFEMVVNLRTAKALGLQLPKTFLARADRVIR